MAQELQLQRYELKYLVPESVALGVRDFVQSYLEIDEFGATLPNFSYPVHSLYLDSDNLRLYRATINGDKNRFKLRLRYYESRPDAPVFFEIKRRMNNIIMKQRGGVRRESVESLLAGHLPTPSMMISKDPKQFAGLSNFLRLMMQTDAKPKVHIFYMREAWISPYDNSVRVTLDRRVLAEVEPTCRLATEMAHPAQSFKGFVILELKFTNRFPDWFRDLVRTFGVMQCGAAKYADGVLLLGEERVNRAFAFDVPQQTTKIPASASEAADSAAGVGGVAVPETPEGRIEEKLDALVK
jgi:SPX domain protein involved in polyphosphate accumulation